MTGQRRDCTYKERYEVSRVLHDASYFAWRGDADWQEKIVALIGEVRQAIAVPFIDRRRVEELADAWVAAERALAYMEERGDTYMIAEASAEQNAALLAFKRYVRGVE
jgi:hypothetical protein